MYCIDCGAPKKRQTDLYCSDCRAERIHNAKEESIDESMHRHSLQDINIGYGTIKHGPGLDWDDDEGWHLPGGGFTTRRRVAEQWAKRIHNYYLSRVN